MKKQGIARMIINCMYFTTWRQPKTENLIHINFFPFSFEGIIHINLIMSGPSNQIKEHQVFRVYIEELQQAL